MEAKHLKYHGDFGRLSLLKSFRSGENGAVQISNLGFAAPPMGS